MKKRKNKITRKKRSNLKTVKKKKLIAGIVLAIILGVILGTSAYWYVASSETAENDYDNFAKCLTEKGVKMYGADLCGHCANQKRMFGESFQYITYIECTQSQEICISEGIRGYPTWKYNGQSYPGEKTLQALSDLSGCDL